MTTLKRPSEYLSEHYVYEINMLRWTFAELTVTPEGRTANALIESFCVHARSLMDFYKSVPRGDDVVATHFVGSGQFSATHTSRVPGDVRVRLNKQIAHLTAGREDPTKKVDTADRQTLLAAIEADHAAFKHAVDTQYANCFTKELVSAATIHATGAASATNSIQFSSATN